ncbi:MAG TPA: FAD-linked oxidase C-terminal domain-containing protein, partial [Nevskiaceae bacterium]
VPISALSDSVAQARRDIEAAGLTAAMVGNVGDGNYHVMFLFDPQDNGQRRTIEGINSAMIDRALAVQGTCTGEHGIGLGRREKLRKQFGDDTLSLMRSLKRAWDPNGILNPGKMFPQAA